MMRALRAGLAALLLCFAFAASADVAVPPLAGRVVDRTGTLSADRIAALDATLRDFEARKGSQVAVLLVPTTEPETIEQFSLRVAEQWKIGRKKIDDGAILVVAKDDRALRIEVGYGLEGALSDVTAKRIIDEIIVPQFRNGDFAGGIEAGVARMLKVIDGEPLPKPKPERTNAFDGVDPFNPFLIVGVLVIGGILRSILGRLIGALATGVLAALAAYFLIGTLTVAAIAGIIAFVFTLISDSVTSGGSGGYSGGGWSGGASGSSGGGFSGGGGSFGGGGASGKW
jgi:uncharacterized protein